MPRRPNPKPALYVAKDGTKTWRIRYRIGAGEHVVNTSETFDTKRDALDFAADIRDFGAADAVRRLTERDAPATASSTTGPTLDSVFEEFLAWTSGRVRSTRTPEDYRAQWDRVSAGIGGDRTVGIGGLRPVDEVTEDDVQRWVDGMAAGTISPRLVKDKATDPPTTRTAPLKPKTIANRHGLLHSVFKFAAARGHRYISVNPCADTALPKRRRGMPKGLRPGEWAALHAALRQLDPDAADLAQCLYASGARFGEVTALQTWSVEDDGERVNLIIDHVNRRQAGGVYERVEDTKSEAGFRRVQLGRGASKMVRRRVDAADAGGLVFTNRHGRTWLHTTFYTRWYQAVDVANLSRRPTPHWLRHTHVVELIDKGVPLPEIQARVGHESIKTTSDIYGRMRRGIAVSVLDALDEPEELPAGPVVTGEIVSGG